MSNETLDQLQKLTKAAQDAQAYGQRLEQEMATISHELIAALRKAEQRIGELVADNNYLRRKMNRQIRADVQLATH